MWIVFYCFEPAPKDRQLWATLQNTNTHLRNCLAANAVTLGILYGCGKVEKKEQRRRELKSELSKLGLNYGNENETN